MIGTTFFVVIVDELKISFFTTLCDVISMFKALFSDKSVAPMFLQSDREKSCAVGGCLWIIGLEKERKEMSEELIPVQILLFFIVKLDVQ